MFASPVSGERARELGALGDTRLDPQFAVEDVIGHFLRAGSGSSLILFGDLGHRRERGMGSENCREFGGSFLGPATAEHPESVR